MAETLAVQLTRVQAAIAAILDGAQSYSIANHTYTRASLSELRDHERSILNRIAYASAGGDRTVAEF